LGGLALGLTLAAKAGFIVGAMAVMALFYAGLWGLHRSGRGIGVGITMTLLLVIAFGAWSILMAVMEGAALVAAIAALVVGRKAEPAARRWSVIQATAALLLVGMTVVMMVVGAVKGHRADEGQAVADDIRVSSRLEAELRGGQGVAYPRALAEAVCGPRKRVFSLSDLTADSLKAPPTSIIGVMPTAGWARYTADVDAYADYVYVGGDLGVLPWNAQRELVVVLYSKRTYGGGRVVAFGDDHARLVQAADVASVFERSNFVRRNLGLPPVPEP
jgi:hypothetical protein